jgi:hypothetical protein
LSCRDVEKARSAVGVWKGRASCFIVIARGASPRQRTKNGRMAGTSAAPSNYPAPGVG